MKRLKITVAASTVAFALSACGAAGSSGVASSEAPQPSVAAHPTNIPAEPGSITIGSANFPEAELLAYLYAGAMRERGVDVKVHPNIGERTTYMAALADGSIGAVPEYSGALLNYLNRTAPQKKSEDTYKALKQEAVSAGLVIGNYSPAEDVDTLTVTKATATKYRLRSIGDLKSVAGDLSLGAAAPLQTVPYGTRAIESAYGVKFGKFVSLSPTGSITQTALKNGTVDVADIFSTDPSIKKNGFVTLADPRDVFAAENVVPVFRADEVTKPMLEGADALSATLSTEDLQSLVAEVIAGKDPSTAAADWLGAHLDK